MRAVKIGGLLGVFVIVLLAFVIIWNADIIGVAAGGLERNAREKQNIADHWEMAQALNDDLCAMLFYNEITKDYTYSIYLKKDEAVCGYFFSQGGQDPCIGEGVCGMVFDDKGIALLSMNQDNVCKIEVNDGVTQKTIEIDPVKPFVVVIPINSGEITMYNSQGDVVSLYDTYR